MTVQTAFRLDEDLVRRLKNRARRRNSSLNQYVTEILEDSVRDEKSQVVLEEFKALFKVHEEISPEILRVTRFSINPDELDEKGKYIYYKGHEEMLP